MTIGYGLIFIIKLKVSRAFAFFVFFRIFFFALFTFLRFFFFTCRKSIIFFTVLFSFCFHFFDQGFFCILFLFGFFVLFFRGRRRKIGFFILLGSSAGTF